MLNDYLPGEPRRLAINRELTLLRQPQPLFSEELWADTIPSLFQTTKILQDPGCNVSYWNLHARTLEKDGDTTTVNGQRLRFFNFSGFQPERPYWLSKHATRAKGSKNAVLLELCRSYAALLEEHGYKEAIREPSRRSQLVNGIPYDEKLRRLYKEAVAEGEDFGNIFNPEGAEAFLRWLNAPSQWGGRHGVTRFMHDGIYTERPDVQREFWDLNGPDGAAFVSWFATQGRREHDLPEQLVPANPDNLQDAGSPQRTPKRRSAAKANGVNVVGYLTGEMGLGEVARQYISALQSVEIPFATKTFVNPWSINKRDFGELGSSEEYSTNLICLQPLDLREFHKQAGGKFFSGRRSIGVWGWESNVFPEEYLTSLKFVDEVWVWTNYVAETLSQVSSKPIAVVPPPVVIRDPGDATVDLGIPAGFTFLFLFDFHSVVERKNPLGLIEAFKRAFAPGEGPQLVIKSINGDFLPEDLEELEVAALDRPDIHVVDRYLSLPEKTALVANCDCYVSLHRSEGFGLTPAEAMGLGKPVIATNYSGNTDFMTDENSYLVPYTLTEVGPGWPPYPPESLWAEPDLNHAASLMRRVWENPDEAKARGERARQDIERTLSPEAVGKIMRARFEGLAEAPATTAPSPASRAEVHSTNTGDADDQLQVAKNKLKQGPDVEVPSRLGRVRRLARRLVLRSMRPFTSYQGQLDTAIIGSIQETSQKIRQLEANIRKRDEVIEGQLVQIRENLGVLEPDALTQKSKSSNLRLCKVCDLPDWEDEELRALLDELDFQTHLDESGYSWAKERKHRKGWEWAKGIQGLKHLGALKPEATAIGVGAGHEAPLYYLANHIQEVHATDIYGSGVFAEGEGSAEMLTNPKKFAPFPYREDHLVVKYMDGCNLEYPDESFDIAFSFSSIEHFGDHRTAAQAMREMARVLRPGGIAAITTELILNDVPHPEFFRPEELYEYLVEPSGLELVEDIDFTISPSLVEKPIDMDAFVTDKLSELWAFARCEHTSENLYNLDWSTDYGDVLPYIVLKTGPVVFTSVIMFLQKPA